MIIERNDDVVTSRFELSLPIDGKSALATRVDCFYAIPFFILFETYSLLTTKPKILFFLCRPQIFNF